MVKIQKHSEEVVKLRTQVADLENTHKRVLADYHNQERRHKELESQIIKMAAASLIEKLLLDIDALKMAQNHLKDKGLQMVIEKIGNTLASEGLNKIETDGKDFDPLTMDCTEVVPGEKDRVVETISEGYYLFDKILRAAKVRVGSGTNTHPREGGDPSDSSGA
jgi:molecular chaperone GrpE